MPALDLTFNTDGGGFEDAGRLTPRSRGGRLDSPRADDIGDAGGDSAATFNGARSSRKQPMSWCTLPRNPNGDGGCAWRGEQLGQAMLQQVGERNRYNELVFDYAQW